MGESMFKKTIDSELGRYEPEEFHKRKNKINQDMVRLNIDPLERDRFREKGINKAHKYLKNG